MGGRFGQERHVEETTQFGTLAEVDGASQGQERIAKGTEKGREEHINYTADGVRTQLAKLFMTMRFTTFENDFLTFQEKQG